MKIYRNIGDTYFLLFKRIKHYKIVSQCSKKPGIIPGLMEMYSCLKLHKVLNWQFEALFLLKQLMYVR